MLLLLNEDDLELWLGQIRAPLKDIKDLIKTYEFNPGESGISVEDPNTKPPRPRKPKSKPPLARPTTSRFRDFPARPWPSHGLGDSEAGRRMFDFIASLHSQTSVNFVEPASEATVAT